MSYIKRAGVDTGQPATTSGGTLGSGETAAIGKGGESTANQSPSGFYNIQDFLKANQGQSQIANQVEQRGQEALGRQTSQFESNRGQLSAVPDATEYTPEAMQNALQSDEYDTMRSGYNQSYNPQTQEQIQGTLNQGISNPFANMRSGDFGSIMNFFGQSQPTSSQYTKGMQKQDELLLRGKPGAVEQIPTRLQNMYQQQVTGPMQQLAQQRAQQEAQAGERIGQAKQAWQGGVRDWLGKQDQALQSKLAEQQQQYNYTPQMTGADMEVALKQMFGDRQGGYATEIQSPQDVANYYTKQSAGTAPNLNTAAGGTGLDINDYNELAGLAGGSQIAATPFEAPQWGWDSAGLQNYVNTLNAMGGTQPVTPTAPTGTPTGGVSTGGDLTQQYNKRIGA